MRIRHEPDWDLVAVDAVAVDVGIPFDEALEVLKEAHFRGFIGTTIDGEAMLSKKAKRVLKKQGR